mgnify:CR=1 FL=1
MVQEPLKNFIPKFISVLEKRGCSPSTILAYRSDLEQLLDFLQKRNKVVPEQIYSTDIENFRNTLASQKYTPKSISRKLNAIKTFFRWLISEKQIISNPVEGVAHPRIEYTAPKHLSQLEYRALRDVVRDDLRILTIIELILQTGMRISEVANLKLENVKENEITIEAYASQPERKIPLNKRAKEAIGNYLKIRPKTSSPFFFVSKNGQPLAIRNIRFSIDKYMQQAEITKYTINDLRTTFIVENLKAGVDLILISQVAGHRRISTTEHYLALAGIKSPGKKQELVEL